MTKIAEQIIGNNTVTLLQNDGGYTIAVSGRINGRTEISGVCLPCAERMARREFGMKVSDLSGIEAYKCIHCGHVEHEPNFKKVFGADLPECSRCFGPMYNVSPIIDEDQ